ncbi:acriflavin resistance protein [Oceanococcus atlanticus]|uniref:Acriflavin resistance protein n=1 Tax=Oceanococcus atlanticus TaxID=1317117 RepID=A0A1Y1SBX4_9GAMM|nr:efflux RND transporter permease subunit [Oceanococcus atlanticus]ORE86150.1 acriflavin resistance protein [Oceanococcus atlanticus]
MNESDAAGRHRNDLIGQFAQHPVACNLLMVMMLMAGLWGLSKLNTQLFPTFSIDYINIVVPWSGASAEDVEEAVVNVIEDKVRNIAGVREMTSVSKRGWGGVWLRFETGTNLNAAADEVDQAITGIRNLPQDAEDPVITILENRELISRLVVTGSESLAELRPIARRMEQELLAKGIAEIRIIGLPEEEIAIQVERQTLHELGLSLPDIAARVRSQSQDVPAGELGQADISRELRAVEKRRSELGFERLPLYSQADGSVLTLGDVATVSRRARDGSLTMRMNGQTAVELALYRSSTDDTLDMARTVDSWLADFRQQIPPGFEISVYDEQWKPLQERISLMVKNGASGLVLVVLILFVFLTGRVAFWVTVGIPVSFMATLMVLYLIGGSIDMISLFALIMALGIIVDDAIVVGEDALTHYQQGGAPLQAAEGGARRMFWPVISSSLTTIAAFLPLMLIGDYIGAILGAIPWVIVCVIIASLIESFLILPGHLRHAFVGQHHRPESALRGRLNAAFDRFRDEIFRPVIRHALNHRRLVVAGALSSLMLVFGLMAGGRIGFVFFPTPEVNMLIANAGFAAGTPRERMSGYMAEIEAQIRATDEALGGGLVRTAVTRLGMAIQPGTNFTRTGDQYAHIQIELLESDHRDVRNTQFIQELESRVVRRPEMDSFGVFEPSLGPPGRDLEIRISGHDATALKQAALELTEVLSATPGVAGVEDDTPYGREQVIFELNPVGKALGLSTADIGKQLRASFEGEIVQIIQIAGDEVEVRVTGADAERDHLRGLDSLPIRLPSGQTAPLGNLVDLHARRGFERLRHAGGQLAIKVTGDVIESIANANLIRADLQSKVLPELATRYPVQFAFTGQAEDQAATLGDMQRGLIYGLAMIYLVLAWVFGSYGWPLVVMSIIPFGLVGALFGHWLMGLDLTILSLFGFFGLSGIVVNDSIILVAFYKELREKGLEVQEALIEASCQRLRAVMLTSLTTIAGLTPLMFETSLQARFMIPMATSITFGLAFATALVLILVPTLLSLYEQAVSRWPRRAEAAISEQR